MKKGISIIVIVLLIQIISYLLFSERLILNSIDSSYEEFFKDIPKKVVVIYKEGQDSTDKYLVSSKDKLYLESWLRSDFDSVTFASSKDVDYKGDILYYYLSVNRTNYFFADVNESLIVKDEEYDMLTGGDWHTTYVWIFFRWFKIKKINTGVS